MKILIAEDDSSISTIMTLSLEHMGGHSVVVCENGQKAIEYLRTQSVDLVLMDSMMPVMDGITALRTIKEDLELGVPVLFLSAKSDENFQKECVDLGAVGFIQKPFDPNSICEEIEHLLKKAM